MVDEALEAMLDAELEGWHDNEDDFDAIHATLRRSRRRSPIGSGVLAGRIGRRRRRLLQVVLRRKRKSKSTRFRF